MHDCVLWMEVNQDVEGACTRFHAMWDDTEAALGDDGRIDYWERGRSYAKSRIDGERILRDWWHIIQWESDVILGRELYFEVPIGEHTLVGTLDKLALRYNPKLDQQVVLISDYKTAAKVPTYEYLEDDLQFAAYGYASTQPEFWTPIPNGEALFRQLKDAPRWGEWVHLKTPRRMDAGIREQRHFNRLRMAVDAFAASVDLRIFVPNISGESCKYCAHRKRCGLFPIEEEDFAY